MSDDDDENTPSEPMQVASREVQVLEDVAFSAHAAAVCCAEATHVIGHMEPQERARYRAQLARLLAQLGDICHEARRAIMEIAQRD